MFYVDTKGLGPNRTQKCIDAFVSLGFNRVDGIEGLNSESKCELKFGEFRYVGITGKNQIMMYPKASCFAEGATPITYNKLMELEKANDRQYASTTTSAIETARERI